MRLRLIAPYGALIPAYLNGAHSAAVAACDGALGSSTQRGSDRRLEGWPPCWGAEIQEARLRPLPPRRQQWSLCSATALSGSRCERLAGNRTGREAKASQRVTNRRHAGAARRPWSPCKGLAEARRSFQGGPVPRPPGPAGAGPRAAHAAPAYPSHLAYPRRARGKETARAQSWKRGFRDASSSGKAPGSPRRRPVGLGAASGNAGGEVSGRAAPSPWRRAAAA